MSGRVLLEVVTKSCFQGKKDLQFSIFETILLKWKQCGATKKLQVFW